jgi:hypothetical protein
MEYKTIKILTCTCENKYQDEIYGDKKRAHNLARGKGTTPIWVCTVCDNKKN